MGVGDGVFNSGLCVRWFGFWFPLVLAPKVSVGNVEWKRRFYFCSKGIVGSLWSSEKGFNLLFRENLRTKVLM